MKKFQIAFVAAVGVPAVVLGVGYLFNGEYRAKIKRCQELGVATYKEAGIYPYFSTGQRTEDAVKEKCYQSDGRAFGPTL